MLGRTQEEQRPPAAEDPVLYVRTKVTSYWRGRSLGRFDGLSWSTDISADRLRPSANRDGVWLDPTNMNRDSRAFYQQTFYVRSDNPDSIFTGYSALSIQDLDGSMDGVGVNQVTSYRVLSSYPEHNADRLQQDSTWVGSRHLIDIPPDSRRLLVPLADGINQGAASDFEKVERIVSYVRREGTFDAGWPEESTGEARLEEFLAEGEPGNAMDYARPRLCWQGPLVCPPAWPCGGYLPGSRDLLSGAYRVSRSDAHAWAEVYFADSGWIPSDGLPRSSLVAGGTAAPGVGFLFRAGVGEAVIDPVMSAPGHILRAILGALGNPVLSAAVSLVLLVGLGLRWAYSHRSEGRVRPKTPLHYPARLPSAERKELLSLYCQLEKLLQRRSGIRRGPCQTVGRFTSLAAPSGDKFKSQLIWFTRAVWCTAYDPGELPTGLVAEARARLNWISQGPPAQRA